MLSNIQEHCQCSFVRDRITDEAFHCIPASPQAVIYRATLHGTASATSSELISRIEQWTSTRAGITVDQTQLNVDWSCFVVASPSDLSAEGCSSMRETTTSLSYYVTTATISESPTSSIKVETQSVGPSGDYTVAFIGAGTVVVVVIVISIAVVLVTALILKINHHTHNKSDITDLKHHQTR